MLNIFRNRRTSMEKQMGLDSAAERAANEPWMFDPQYAIHPRSKVGQNYLSALDRYRKKQAAVGGGMMLGHASHGGEPLGQPTPNAPPNRSIPGDFQAGAPGMDEQTRHGQHDVPSRVNIGVKPPGGASVPGLHHRGGNSTGGIPGTVFSSAVHRQKPVGRDELRHQTPGGYTARGGDHVRGQQSAAQFPATIGR